MVDGVQRLVGGVPATRLARREPASRAWDPGLEFCNQLDGYGDRTDS